MDNSITIFEKINSLLKSKVSNVKDKISTGTFTPPHVFPKNFETNEDIQLMTMTINNTYGDFLLKIATNNEQQNQLVIHKPIDVLKKSPHLIYPNAIIEEKRLQLKEITQSEKKIVNIFRTTKRQLRSLSKEIDKRTKKEFKLVRKKFDYMQFDNRFLGDRQMNLNSNARMRNIKSINLPHLNLHSSFLLRESSESNIIQNTSFKLPCLFRSIDFGEKSTAEKDKLSYRELRAKNDMTPLGMKREISHRKMFGIGNMNL